MCGEETTLRVKRQVDQRHALHTQQFLSAVTLERVLCAVLIDLSTHRHRYILLALACNTVPIYTHLPIGSLRVVLAIHL